MAKLPYLILRHWLPSTLFVLCAIFSYAKSPLYGADPTPTPNVSTVPKPGQLFTPTPTPAPVIVIITQEAPPTATAVAPADPPAGTNEGTPGAQPGSAPAGASPNNNTGGTATNNLPTAPGTTAVSGVIIAEQVNLRQSPNITAAILATLPANTPVTLLGRTAAADWFYLCCGGQPPQNGWVSAPFVQVTSGDLLALPVITGELPPDLTMNTPVLAITAVVTPTLIWQDAVVQLQLAISNRGRAPATNLLLQHKVPSWLHYLKSEIEGEGATMTAIMAADGERTVMIRWPTLQPNAQYRVTVTLQVDNNATNGTFLDNYITVESSQETKTTTTFTLAMPPKGLPQFR